MNKENDTTRFTIQDETADTPDSLYVADAENLRIEKLSTRVTLVAVLIPCLLVVVLAVAYLDIKSRVASTQNTGTIGVQNLAKDLESRFSSLSLKQAKLEQQLSETAKTLETASAALQVKLNRVSTEFKKDIDKKADKSDLAALTQKEKATLDAIKKDMLDLNASFSKFDEELADQILLMANGFKKDQERLATVEKKVLQLDGEKLSKESLSLSIGLERLALQELVKEKIGEVEKELTRISKQIDTLEARLNAQAKQQAVSPPHPSPVAASPSTVPPAATPADNPQSQSSRIEEQTIN